MNLDICGLVNTLNVINQLMKDYKSDDKIIEALSVIKKNHEMALNEVRGLIK